MKRFKKYIFILSLLIVSKLHAQLNEFMIQWYFYEDEFIQIPTNPNIPWKTNYIGFLNEMKSYNFNTVFFENTKNEFNTNKITDAKNNGLKVMLNMYSSIKPTETYNQTIVLNTLNDNNNHDNIVGYSIMDEPWINNSGWFDWININKCSNCKDYVIDNISKIANEIKTKDDYLLRWCNFYPSLTYSNNTPAYYYKEGYVQEYINRTKPNILSFDEYPIAFNFDNPNFYTFFQTLYILGTKSVENSIPFFYVLTPFHNKSNFTYIKTNLPSDNYFPAKSISEFNYVIYAALAYGAKGIAYWPGFKWVVAGVKDSEGEDINYLYHFKLNYQTSTTDYLTVLHGKLLAHSDELLSLNFASAYHKDSVSTIDPTKIEIMPKFCSWENFKKDKYAQQIFYDTNYPIYNPATGIIPQELAITFLTNKDGKIYFWLFNKSLTSTINFNIAHYDDGGGLRDVLNNQIVPFYTQVALNAGEGKLFTLNTLSSTQINYTLSNLPPYESKFYPFESANQISIGIQNATTTNVTFQPGANKSFMAKNIIINSGVRIESGSTVRLNAYTNSNNLIGSGPSFVSKHNLIDKPNEKLFIEPYVYPNPTKDNFLVKTTLSENERIEVLVYDNMGRNIKTVETSSENTFISLQNESAGVYFVRFKQNNQIYNFKIIKL